MLYQAAGTGFLTPTGSFVSYDTWNTFAIEFDYATIMNRYFFNGVEIATGGFVDAATDFNDGNISGLQLRATPLRKRSLSLLTLTISSSQRRLSLRQHCC